MKNIIENLFYDYQQTEEYVKDFKNMPRREDIQAARDRLVKPIAEQDRKAGNELDDLLTGALCAIEDFAFVQGFKYAMRLRNECNIQEVV